MSYFYERLCDKENHRVHRTNPTSERASAVPSHGGLRSVQHHTTPEGLETQGGRWQQQRQGSILREESTLSQRLLDITEEGWAVFLKHT